MSRAGRYYGDVQSIFTELLNAGVYPDTETLGKQIFKDEYSRDSRKQREIIYQCIVRGRDNALDKWEHYIDTPEYLNDLADIEYYRMNEAEAQLATDDFAEFHTELYRGRFGTDTQTIKANLDSFLLVALAFSDKMNQFAKEGDHFVISTYGPDSTWRIPTWWKWSIRETKLYLRTIHILRKQLKRGVDTKMLTRSGVPLEKAIGYTSNVRAVLEDGTSWPCSKCGIINAGDSNFCTNCGTGKS